MTKYKDIKIEAYDPKGEDFSRVGRALSAFSLDKGASEYIEVSKAFAAVADGKVVGEAIATQLSWGITTLNLLHVDETHRGVGIGRQLVEAVENWARENNATAIDLWTPEFQGRGFYEKLGYRITKFLPTNVYLDGKRQFRLDYSKTLSQ